MTSSYFSRWWLHAEASFSRNAGGVGGGGEGQFRSHSPSLAHGSPSMRTHPTHARTLVVHRSHARTLLISCPPEATAGGSAPLIDRPNSLLSWWRLRRPRVGERLPFRRPTKPRQEKELGEGINEELIAGPHDDFFSHCD